MIPENQVSRKKPYVLLPPTAIPSESGPHSASGQARNGEAALSFQISFREAESVPRATTAGVVATRPHAPTRSLPLGLGLLLFLVLPSALGAVAGFHLAEQWAHDAMTWSIAGGAAGLVLGGVCLLWNRRKG